VTEALRAKCFDCTCDFADGRRDCKVRDCPVYPRMPYRKMKPVWDWIFGAWTKRHRLAANAKGMTACEYAEMKWKKGPGKYRVPPSEIMRAKCFRCMADCNQGGGERGKFDCEINACPIYFWMPFREGDVDLSWLFENAYTNKHRRRMDAEGLTEEEYIRKYIPYRGKYATTEIDEDEEEEGDDD
jgi:hypothetical protein